jgi:hypothetical protein
VHIRRQRALRLLHSNSDPNLALAMACSDDDDDPPPVRHEQVSFQPLQNYSSFLFFFFLVFWSRSPCR